MRSGVQTTRKLPPDYRWDYLASSLGLLSLDFLNDSARKLRTSGLLTDGSSEELFFSLGTLKLRVLKLTSK